MKKFFKAMLLLLFVVAFMVVASSGEAAQYYSPYRNHTGNIGDSTHIWQYGYFDNLIGDGTNAYMYGFRYTIVSTPSSTTAVAGQSGKVFKTAGSNTQVSLPTASAGLYYTFIVSSGSLYIKPKTTVTIYGVSGTAASYAAKSTAVGDSITVMSDGTSWFVIKAVGTWTSGAPL